MGTLRCLHCQTPLNLSDETVDQDISCPTCGSRSPLNEPHEPKDQIHRPVIGRFELLEEVGRGQFGTVWRARDTRLERIVALKVPRQEELDLHTRHMFLREANAAAALNHPNIVRVYEVFEEEGQIYIASEFINGDDLKFCLGDSEAFLTYQDVVRFMISTADAVHYAHEKGIVHRDIKPGNILVDGVSQPHLTDFGLAKIESHEATMTVRGDQPIGTLSYMSPEQAAGEVHGLDRRSDVFSLGSVLYEMLTRQRAFPGVALDILDKVRHTEPVDPREIKPELPQDLVNVCQKALAKDRASRYQSALELADDLRRCLAGIPTIARPVSPGEKAVKWLRKHLIAASIAAVALISTAAAATTFFHVPGGVPVELTTFPPGAQVALFPIDPATSEPQYDKIIYAGKSPARVRLKPGDYMVVPKLSDGRFHEVYRHVPTNPNTRYSLGERYPHRYWRTNESGVVQLPLISIPEMDVDQGMALFSGLSEESAKHLAPFLLDTREVTVEEFKQPFIGAVPANFHPDATLDPASPITNTLFDYAVWYAECIGKRLPTEREFEFAATNGGATMFPWGNELLPVSTSIVAGFDQTQTTPPVQGLMSGAAEFTATQYSAEGIATTEIPGDWSLKQRFKEPHEVLNRPTAPLFDAIAIRGTLGSEPVSGGTRSSMARAQLSNHVGFRCARTSAPRW